VFLALAVFVFGMPQLDARAYLEHLAVTLAILVGQILEA